MSQLASHTTTQPVEESDLTIARVTGSVLADFFGVQSKENKVRGFTRGKPLHFIAAGLICTVGFMAFLLTIVTAIV